MSFTGNKNLELPANGSYVGFWNVPMNGDMTIIDSALGGSRNLTTLSGAYTLTVDDYQPLILNLAGTLTANVTYTIPSGVGGQWIVNNQTDGAFTVTFTTGAVGGTTQTVSQGLQTLIASDGTDIWLVSPQTAAGSDRQIQFNNNGVLGASSNLVFNTSGDVIAGGTIAMASSFKRNRIINGNMLIDQRNAGAAVTVTAASAAYAADRFRIYHDTAVTGSWTAQQSTQVPTTGYVNSLSLTNGTAATPGASDVNIIQQRIEGYNVADLNFGSSTAATVTVSFWVRSSVAGTYGFGLTNSAQNRSYVSTYSIASVNTWQQVNITIAGDQAGTWLTNNGVGLMATWDLGSGSSINTTAGTWAAGQYFRTSGCVTWINNSSATFYITGVQLEVGTKATPYEMQIYSDQLAQCQRYYYKLKAATAYTNGGVGRAYSVTNAQVFVALPVSMRAAPTGSYSALADWNDSGGGIPSAMDPVSQYSADYRWMTINLTGTYASGQSIALNANNTVGAFISWSAEL